MADELEDKLDPGNSREDFLAYRERMEAKARDPKEIAKRIQSSLKRAKDEMDRTGRVLIMKQTGFTLKQHRNTYRTRDGRVYTTDGHGGRIRSRKHYKK